MNFEQDNLTMNSDIHDSHEVTELLGVLEDNILFHELLDEAEDLAEIAGPLRLPKRLILDRANPLEYMRPMEFK